MGLAQKIQFQHSGSDEIKNFILKFCQPYQPEQIISLFILSLPGGKGYRFEMAVESYGLYLNRSGNYFEILGKLIEELTGSFGKITIEDI